MKLWLSTCMDFIQTYNSAITALATAFIAIFTIVLAFVTNSQAQITQAAVQLSRDEFNAAHRPKLRARLVRLDSIDSADVKAHYTIVNVGETAATMTVHEITISAESVNDATKAIQQRISCYCLRLVGGESKVILTGMTFDLEQEYDFAFQVRSGGFLRMRGRLEYTDDVGIKRRTGFLRTYDAKLGRFCKGDDPEEEYED